MERLFDYQVTFVFDYAYIGMAVFAESEELAVERAHQQLIESDIQYPEPNEITVELVGEFA